MNPRLFCRERTYHKALFLTYSFDPTFFEHLGDIYLKQGKYKEAIQQWELSVAEWKVAAPGDQVSGTG